MLRHRVSGLSSKTGAEPMNRTLVSLKELYRQVYVQPENGDMGSKRLSDAMFEVDWIVEYLKTLLGLISPEMRPAVKRYALHACKIKYPPRNPYHIPTAKPSTPHLRLPPIPTDYPIHMHVLCRPSLSVRAANLLLMNLERISICHVKLCRFIESVSACNVE